MATRQELVQAVGERYRAGTRRERRQILNAAYAIGIEFAREGKVPTVQFQRAYPTALCIKHRFRKTGVKMYDKFGRVLRLETTTNDVSF